MSGKHRLRRRRKKRASPAQIAQAEAARRGPSTHTLADVAPVTLTLDSPRSDYLKQMFANAPAVSSRTPSTPPATIRARFKLLNQRASP